MLQQPDKALFNYMKKKKNNVHLTAPHKKGDILVLWGKKKKKRCDHNVKCDVSDKLKHTYTMVCTHLLISAPGANCHMAGSSWNLRQMVERN